MDVSMIPRSMALMFPVSGEDVILRLLGTLHSSCLPVKLHRAGDGAADDV